MKAKTLNAALATAFETATDTDACWLLLEAKIK
jgi:hypothetical protein